MHVLAGLDVRGVGSLAHRSDFIVHSFSPVKAPPATRAEKSSEKASNFIVEPRGIEPLTS
jgi:hypothetical protein